VYILLASEDGAWTQDRRWTLREALPTQGEAEQAVGGGGQVRLGEDARSVDMKAYLAGGFYSDWRKQIEDAQLGFDCFDPQRDNDQSASYRFVRDDLAAIDAADFVIAYYPGGYTSHGMAAEMGYASALRKTIIYIDETDRPDLFLVGLSKRLFTSVDAFIEWWRKRMKDGRPVL
jgi:hypothetical protein